MKRKKTLLFLFILMSLGVLACGTETLFGPTSTPKPPPTPTLSPAMKIGDSFKSGDFDIKLLEVAEWPKITLLNSKSYNAIAPKQASQSWLVVNFELSSNNPSSPMSLGKLTSILSITKGDSVIIDPSGVKYELAAVGAPVPPEKGWFLTQVQEQYPTLMVVIFNSPTSGSVFITPDGNLKLAVVPNPLKDSQMDLGVNSVLADPTSLKWYVGLGKEGDETTKTAKFSLLYEIPKGASGLQLKFFDAALVTLPQATAGVTPTLAGGGGLNMSSMTLTNSEKCKAWAVLLPCR